MAEASSCQPHIDQGGHESYPVTKHIQSLPYNIVEDFRPHIDLRRPYVGLEPRRWRSRNISANAIRCPASRWLEVTNISDHRLTILSKMSGPTKPIRSSPLPCNIAADVWPHEVTNISGCRFTILSGRCPASQSLLSHRLRPAL